MNFRGRITAVIAEQPARGIPYRGRKYCEKLEVTT